MDEALFYAVVTVVIAVTLLSQVLRGRFAAWMIVIAITALLAKPLVLALGYDTSRALHAAVSADGATALWVLPQALYLAALILLASSRRWFWQDLDGFWERVRRSTKRDLATWAVFGAGLVLLHLSYWGTVNAAGHPMVTSRGGNGLLGLIVAVSGFLLAYGHAVRSFHVARTAASKESAVGLAFLAFAIAVVATVFPAKSLLFFLLPLQLVAIATGFTALAAGSWQLRLPRPFKFTVSALALLMDGLLLVMVRNLLWRGGR